MLESEKLLNAFSLLGVEKAIREPSTSAPAQDAESATRSVAELGALWEKWGK